jgi:hypothetical protein
VGYPFLTSVVHLGLATRLPRGLTVGVGPSLVPCCASAGLTGTSGAEWDSSGRDDSCAASG